MRTLISHRGGKAPRKKKVSTIEEMCNTWFKEMSQSKSLRAGLHPEDESHLIEYFAANA
jgi:hypothetical protein